MKKRTVLQQCTNLKVPLENYSIQTAPHDITVI